MIMIYELLFFFIAISKIYERSQIFSLKKRPISPNDKGNALLTDYLVIKA